MNKQQAATYLCKIFGFSHVAGWLSKFPENHTFDKDTIVATFVDYLNSLDTRPVTNIPRS